MHQAGRTLRHLGAVLPRPGVPAAGQPSAESMPAGEGIQGDMVHARCPRCVSHHSIARCAVACRCRSMSALHGVLNVGCLMPCLDHICCTCRLSETSAPGRRAPLPALGVGSRLLYWSRLVKMHSSGNREAWATQAPTAQQWLSSLAAVTLRWACRSPKRCAWPRQQGTASRGGRGPAASCSCCEVGTARPC